MMNKLTKKALVASFVFGYALLSGLSAMAADTEIFFRDPPANSLKPNVLFVMSTAGTMNGAIDDPDGNSSTKIAVLQDILIDIARTENRINMGLMRYNNPGGPVVYPITDLAAVPSLPPNVITRLDTEVPGGNTIDGLPNDAVYTPATTAPPVAYSLDNDDPSLILGEAGKVVGLHFPSLNIPYGATITSAIISFTPYDAAAYDVVADGVPETFATVDQADSVALDIFVERAVDPDDFVTDSDFSTRAASLFPAVSWVPGTWTAANANARNSLSTPDLSTELNTIVQDVGWCGGNGISVFIEQNAAAGVTGTRAAVSYDTNPTYAPRLSIQWDDSSIDSAAGEGCFQGVATSSIAIAADDAEDVYVDASTTELTADTSDLDLYNADGTGDAALRVVSVGLLFKNLNIPPNSQISEAYVELSTAAANTAAFSTEINVLSDTSLLGWSDGFSTTPSTVAGTGITWSAAAGADDWNTGQIVVTPNIASLIDTAVSSGNGWVNDGYNNNIPIILTGASGTRRLNSYEGRAGTPPQLTVLFTGNYEASTVREELVLAIDDFKLVTGQPTVETYLEAYNYYSGSAVDFGGYRGGPTRTSNRVSHKLSTDGIVTYADGSQAFADGTVSAGTLGTAAACKIDNELSDCRAEVISPEGDAVYIPPPMEQCQTNHIIMLTDGFPTAFNVDSDEKIESVTGIDCPQNDNGEQCGVDLARYMANSDLIDDAILADDQLIKSWTIHFGTVTDRKIRFLSDVAEAGDGEFFIAENGAELSAVFSDVIDALAKVNTSFVSAGITVNQSNRLTHRDELYFSLFRPEPFAHWPGNVKRYRIFGSNILDVNDENAILANSDVFKETAQSFWSATADGNNAGIGGAAEQLDTSRIVFSNLTGDSSITPTGSNLVTLANTTDVIMGTANITERTALHAWIAGTDVDVDNTGASTVYTINTGISHNSVGDPLHSKPTIITYRQDDGSGSLEEFDMVFVGTNHGFLHAFYTEDGTEEWSFIPKELLNNVKDYMDNPDRDPSAHEYGVDGSLTIYIDDINGDGAVDVGTDSVYLFVGLRRGGNSYYAFNITDHDNPELMYTISPTVDGDFDDLAQTWSKPIIAKLADAGVDSGFQLAMTFGAGYDTNQDPSADDVTGSSLIPSPGTGGKPSTDSVGNNIYMINALTGAKIWDAQTHAVGQQYTQAGLTTDMNSIPGDIKAIDPTTPGFFEHLYAADTKGQIFRYDMNPNFDSSTDSTGATLAQGGKLAEIQSESDGTACEEHDCNRRFYYSPDVAIVPRPNGLSFVSISLGSGYRAHPLGTEIDEQIYSLRDMGVLKAETAVVTSETVDTGFSLFDNHDGTVGTAAGSEVITLANLVDVTTNPTGSTALDAIENTTAGSEMAGWYIQLDDGEKVLAEAITFNNRLIFTTYIPPDSSITACAPPQGSGRVYAVNILDGTLIGGDLNNDGVIDADDRYIDLNNIGIPPEPQIIVLGNGPQLLVGRQIATELINVDWGEMDRIKWRERNRR